MRNLKLPNIDQHGVNAVLCAVEAEMADRAAKKGNKLDALLMGGGRLCPADERELALLACRKNWDILYVAMDESQPFETLASGDLEFSFFSTDGVTQTCILTHGRIWKRDRQSQARLIFMNNGAAEIRIKASGVFALRELEATAAVLGRSASTSCRSSSAMSPFNRCERGRLLRQPPLFWIRIRLGRTSADERSTP